jgi:hypothetical protein
MVAEIRATSADWSLRPPVLRRPDLNRTDEVTVDFNSDGALQEINTHYEAVLIFLAQHCAGQAGKAAGFDTDSLARVDVRAGSIGKTGSQHSLQTRNFFIGTKFSTAKRQKTYPEKSGRFRVLTRSDHDRRAA